jgi:ABC-type transport system involved in cytochrome c biogenesis permease subunit
MAALFPWTKRRVGFVLTHASLLIIMLGAAVTYLFKIEGRLFLWEGESASVIIQYDAQGNVVSSRDLPFTVKLDDFVLETYQGTNRPSGFVSYVRVTDNDGGKSFPAKIWMNNQLKYRGYSLFQSSYRQDGGREATELAVSKDPGQGIVFTGYIMLLIGLVWMLISGARSKTATAVASALMLLLFAPSLTGQTVSMVSMESSAPSASGSAPRLAHLPVQHDGRAMPFDTYAREMVKTITGSGRWQGEDPVLTVIQWINNPENAANSNNIKIGSANLAMAMGFTASTKYAPFIQLIQNPGLSQQLNMYNQCKMNGTPINRTISAAVDLERRLDLMRGILFSQTILPIPVPGEPNAAWQALESASADSLSRLLDGPRLLGWPDAKKISGEVFYNKLNLARISWIAMLCSLVFSIIAWRQKRRWMDIAAFSLLLCGFGAMTWSIIMRWQAGERIPAANMYESMLFLSWGMGLFAAVAYGLTRNRIVALNAAVMALVAILLTDLLPMDKFIHPIAPVLAGTPWLAIHVPVIMVGYAVLALGVAAAHMQVGVWIFCPRRHDLADRFYDMLYWYNLVGSILLLAGILTGSMWAAISWGRYWGWDPKEVWSLIAFLAYMAIIHSKACGIVGKFGAAAVSILAFQTVLMTYLGVNFVLSAGMHSYGMGDSPIAVWMFLVALAELAFVGIGTSAYLKQRRDIVKQL